MKNLLIIVPVVFLAFSCGGSSNNQEEGTSANPPQSMVADPEEGKAVGAIKEVALTNPLDQAMVEKGKEIYELKCAACHKLTDQRVVGPGWAGITQKRKPEWIMNMILDIDVMLEEDPIAQALLEECLVRMPNQNLTEPDARSVFEFMRSNDGEK